MSIFTKFDKAVDLQGLKNDIKEVEQNGAGTYKEIPDGQYEVSIAKLELKESKNGKPMLSAQMKILSGEHKGSSIFYNQVIDQGFGIHKANEFLRSLDSGIEVKFDSYVQYEQIVLDVVEAIDGKLEYAIKQETDKKDFKNFEIVDVFEV